ncbi:hypothetical protein [Ferrimicrobium acidiphilum]|uniref:hypothetical protein n=1 Tax=Ferrimicrobium acidiphilum TaxID=121039 RepID=UPI0023F19F92|nr:hypothetical protein [Ferrimicrobium acidiphilum]
MAHGEQSTNNTFQLRDAREVPVEAADKAIIEATSIYHLAIEDLISRIGKETTAELLGTEAISAVRHAKR